ncbi:MAG: hypothetical protein JWM27_4304 [Gemmatimonadetes bacterium]|nr:hypothetical protein [Gemmatimonadota bacterium]
MSFDAERLYSLLPAVHRIRDYEQGDPLRALLEVIAQQGAVLEESLEQLYDDQFVETAAPWALPYIGDLLGIEGLPGEPLTPRAEVANTLSYRRRKGTAHVLERLARDVTGMPARAVEFFQLLATTQHVNHVRLENRAWVSVRDASRLEHLNGPFERLDGEVDITHTADVRRVASGRGRYNLPNVGIFLWRLRAYRLTRSPAVPAGDGAAVPARCFRFDPLGADRQLYNRPVTEEDPATLAQPANVPARITRRAMYDGPGRFYGGLRSILVETVAADGRVTTVPVDRVKVCDLAEWSIGPAALPPPARQPTWDVAVDPVLGRLATSRPQARPPLVTFHYGFAGDLGGGEYGRGTAADDVGTLVYVPARPEGAPASALQAPSIAAALAALDGLGRATGIVEIVDNGRYAVDTAAVSLDARGRRLTLRAADHARPLVLLNGDLRVLGGVDDAVSLDGLLIAGGALLVPAPAEQSNGLGALRIRHCTLVPGHSLDAYGEAVHQGVPSLTVLSSATRVQVERSILGPVRAVMDALVTVEDSIVDAGDSARVAYSDPPQDGPGPALTIRSSTVVGKVMADAFTLASNTIFLADLDPADPPVWTGPVLARRSQEGCMRFCYVPPRSRTPRRFQCQPRRESDDARLRPWPASLRYGDAWYASLPASAPAEVRRGADDESEMGAFHMLYLPQREAHLRARLDEYLRFGLEAGVFYAR